MSYLGSYRYTWGTILIGTRNLEKEFNAGAGRGGGGLIHIGLVTVMLQKYVGGDLEEDPMRQRGNYRLKRRMFVAFVWVRAQ